ncbi:MAG TPA: serine/threonine-protein kinase [Kofleriaceae bacterium]|nr:serine/threonine-protein kinase [Kofleriaceae bacterium]
MSAPFEVFGPYAVYERLGQGGMATVHRAEKRGIGIRRPVALKRLLPHVAADPALIKLFVDEARLASHLRHANVAQTYELGKVGDTFFIAMEYASGPTLAQIIRQCLHAACDIPLTITVNILQQICEALDYAHDLCDESGQPLRIIHRDVSPPNIIVTNTGVVKLIDFGIAKATISSVKTQTGFIKGKFGYIAPEYITGRIDARVDLFAVGVVAHEMMTGRRLFEGADDFETLQNIREMNLQPPSRWNRHVTPDLDDIVMTALQRDPADRWQTAGAMQVALANVARGFGLVVGGQQLAEWVDWAFTQQPRDPGGALRSGADDTSGYRPAPRPGSSLSMEVIRASAPSIERSETGGGDPDGSAGGAGDSAPRGIDLTPPETPAPDTLADTPPPERVRPSRRPRPPSDYDETLPLERIELSRRDIEILTPSPVLEPPPAPPALPVPPRSSRTHAAVTTATGSPPPVPLPSPFRPSLPFAAVPPTPLRPSRVQAAVALPPAVPPPGALDGFPTPRPTLPAPRALDGLPALPDIASSRELEVMPGLRRVTSSREIALPPEPAAPPPRPAPEPAEPTAKPPGKSRPAKATQKTRPQPRSDRATANAAADAETARGPRSRRNLMWLILLMAALGAGAMAAAYYLPDL